MENNNLEEILIKEILRPDTLPDRIPKNPPPYDRCPFPVEHIHEYS